MLASAEQEQEKSSSSAAARKEAVAQAAALESELVDMKRQVGAEHTRNCCRQGCASESMPVGNAAPVNRDDVEASRHDLT